ncbi:MAG: HlyD family type I secretion periplasmic adaptor subunit [Alphaproteobacteria bacterium]|jgi:HlyD family type I secretion membrane fusion protein|nr:HlyD family type I secretion periplasmic adaptor subunit [Candidatus Jidaibacter sp.]
MNRLQKRLHILKHDVMNSSLVTLFSKYLLAKAPENRGYESKIAADLKQSIRGPVRFGMYVISAGFLFFVVWGGLAPLDSAAIAEGFITVSGNHKTIQHLEGGLINDILVKDGQRVEAGDILLKLSDTGANAQLQILASHLNFANATQARLSAEQNKSQDISWDEVHFDLADPNITNLIQTQENLFQYKRDEIQGNVNILMERISQSQEEIIGLQAKQKSLESQLKLINEELQSTEELFKKGLALRPKLLELRRYHDELVASIVEIKSRIASVRQAIAENRLRQLNIENEFQKDLAKEIKDNHSLILELTEKYMAAKDVLERTFIKAPASGVITDLQYHTVGGVIAPGQKIMDIVPEDEKLIIEAKVRTQDIDSIYPGLIAKVQLGAYKSRVVPRLDAKVIYVSADKMVDHQSGMPYYLARIEIDEAEIARLNTEIHLYPGMPVTVFIVKGTRTFLDYMISPIKDSFFKAFKEA